MAKKNTPVKVRQDANPYKNYLRWLKENKKAAKKDASGIPKSSVLIS